MAASDIVSPKGKTSAVWKYFGYLRGKKEGPTALCKVCGGSVERSGGTTNLRSHLRTWHRSIYDQLYPEAPDESCSKQGTMDSFVTRVEKLPYNSERAKNLTKSICEMMARDIRPISMVDDVGFLKLMNKAEPRYIVPCRSTIARHIDDLYISNKRAVRGILADVDFMCCTTDMWTSRSGAGYLSLTCHFITANFEICYKNLQTHHFPGSHDFRNICAALSSSAMDWCIDIDKQVVAFTTDSGSNIVKALDDMHILRLACAGHTLNLAVQKALKVSQVVSAIGRCRKLVAHFHRSRLGNEELIKKQSMFPDVPSHKLIQVCKLQWYFSNILLYHVIGC